MAAIVLITASFPFRNYTEEVFVMPELEALSRSFDKVIIVPQVVAGPLLDLDFPENVEVDMSVCRHPVTRCRLLKLPLMLRPSVARAICRGLDGVRTPGQLASGVFFAANTEIFARMLWRLLRRHGLVPESTLLYCFWFDHFASAAALVAARSGCRAVARAHGHDIFDSEVPFRSHRLRRLALDGLSGVYAASRAGADYMKAHYPEYADKILVARLGSDGRGAEPAACNAPGGDITLLSVARVAEEKRVDRCLALAAAIAQAYPLRRVRWIHVGDGPLMGALRRQAADTDRLPSNLTTDLRGALPNGAVHRIYAAERIDWFLLMSRSEGLPIAICEALSHGVPVVATAVGGVAELVSDDVGLAVAPDATPLQIVGDMQTYLNRYDDYMYLRRNARARWEAEADAAMLRMNFASGLRSLLT